jgi:hypothetical protein
MKTVYIGVKIPLIRGRTAEEILSIFKAYIEEALVEEIREYRWFFVHSNEICIVHSTNSPWMGKMAVDWINKCSREGRPVWITQMDDVFGKEYSIEVCTSAQFKKAYRLGIAEPGKKQWKKFVPGEPEVRVTGYER